LPLDLEPAWPTRADDCLVWGSSIAGAHKFFLARPLVRYRVHDRNSWHGRSFSGHHEMCREYEVNRLVGTLSKRCGYYVPVLLDGVVREFESAGSGRSFEDYRRYREIIDLSRHGRSWRSRKRLQLLRAYLRMWLAQRRDRA
jgi:hypothetical protein